MKLPKLHQCSAVISNIKLQISHINNIYLFTEIFIDFSHFFNFVGKNLQIKKITNNFEMKSKSQDKKFTG